MSKSIIGDQMWAQMNEGQKVEAVFAGRATRDQISEGLLDASEQLRNACREYLAETSLPTDVIVSDKPHQAPGHAANSSDGKSPSRRASKIRVSREALKQRFGLPAGFVPRLQRYGRTVLLELNIYRLPNGQEFIPCRPSGTLGASRHVYALQTCEQYLKRQRGSVYVRTDGKIFDYSIDNQIPLAEIFDTGYTIADLERTGRYAPELRRRGENHKLRKKSQVKVKRAAAG